MDDEDYQRSESGESDSDEDSYEEIEAMYDAQERKKEKEERIRGELQRLPANKEKVYFNVFNICDKYLFNRKMKENFQYLEYKIREIDEDENCIAVSVSKTISEDFLIIDGERFGNLDISLYLDDQAKDSSEEEEEKSVEKNEGKSKNTDWKTQFMQEMSTPNKKEGAKKTGKRQRLGRG